MNLRDVARHRLANQFISDASDKGLAKTVAALGAMQAQDYLGALWAIGLRLPAFTEANVKAGIAERSIIRTWPMRGTLHFVAANDARWMLRLLSPRIIMGSARRHKELELDDKIFRRSAKLFTKAMQGGRQLTRDQAYQLLEDAAISPIAQRGYHILWRLAQEGLICFGTHQDKQPTFALLDEWIPVGSYFERDEALVELARRYFIGRGPATLQDFVWWSGLKMADARAAIEMTSKELAKEMIEGTIYWMRPDTLDLKRERPMTFLLPGFDEYLLGYADRTAALARSDAAKVNPGKNGVFLPTIVMGGRVVGTWQRTFKKDKVVLSANFFAEPNKRELMDFNHAAERYAQFLGLSLQLTS